jgi:hypothetical protein
MSSLAKYLLIIRADRFMLPVRNRSEQACSNYKFVRS